MKTRQSSGVVQDKKNSNIENMHPESNKKTKICSSHAASARKRSLKVHSPNVPKKKGKTINEVTPLKCITATKKVFAFKGYVPVDEECVDCINQFHVYQCGDSVYHAMLNQTDVGRNNNKYYLIQLLKDNKTDEYCAWFRWGRVGKIAGTNLQRLPRDKAISVFKKKFLDKTKNHWEERFSFEKVAGKYDLLKMDYGQTEPETNASQHNPQPEVKSKLAQSLQNLLALLFDTNEFEQIMREMQYDVKKAPLGKLNECQIQAGYASLRNIETSIRKGNRKALVDACNEFYTRIPHDFGMKRPPVLDKLVDVKQKTELLQALSDIRVAISLLDKTAPVETYENPLDKHYKSLDCELVPVDENTDEFRLIEIYAKNTHADTHRNFQLSIDKVFSVFKEDQACCFKKHLGNRMLLWHGSRLTNWCSILKRGLMIAPPEAPSTGYMFGKGIYFADMVSKSANYCFASQRQPVGLLLLCEVALGNVSEKTSADYDGHDLPKGKHSTKGVGKTQPDQRGFIVTDDEVCVPCGKPVHVKEAEGSALLYNEYVVYHPDQVKPRYLVQLNFQFNQGW